MYHRRTGILLLFATIVPLITAIFGCDEECGPTCPEVQFDVASDLTAQIAVWPTGKPAALSLAYDDVRPFSYEVIAPALEAHGFRGTFNLNTGAIGGQWGPWIDLAEKGHELGNHTRNHYSLTELSLDAARWEIEQGRNDLLENVPCLTDVATFAYPNARSNAEIRAIVLEKHISARERWGWNPPSPEDYSRLHSRSYVDLEQIMRDVDRAINTRTWLIAYFHAVGSEGLPEEDFNHYLDHIAARRDSIWVAPQGTVAKYAIERDNSWIELSGDNPGALTIQTSVDPARFNVPLSIQLTAVSDVIELIVVDGEIHVLDAHHSTWIQLRPGDSVSIRGAVAGSTGGVGKGASPDHLWVPRTPGRVESWRDRP